MHRLDQSCDFAADRTTDSDTGNGVTFRGGPRRVLDWVLDPSDGQSVWDGNHRASNGCVIRVAALSLVTGIFDLGCRK